MASEKRRFPRLKESVRIKWRVIRSGEFPGAEIDGFTVNISGGGVCFATDEPVEPGTVLGVEMAVPGFEVPVMTLGRVTWCEKGPERYEVGTEFWWIGWKDENVQRSIGDYIRRALEGE